MRPRESLNVLLPFIFFQPKKEMRIAHFPVKKRPNKPPRNLLFKRPTRPEKLKKKK